jgi:predicted DNA-binding transcriptional regulator YafY
VRADRLVAVLLMLQRQGQVTASEVAAELEVSERTARRDLEALGMAGIPVYSVAGRGGGWRLAGGGSLDLSGLSAPEVRALFLVAGPSSASPEVRAALRKLVRALPEPLRDRAEAAAGSLVVDPVGWGDRTQGGAADPPMLAEVQQAVIDAAAVEIAYTDRTGAPSLREVSPLGVASKGDRWYLVAATADGQRTFRVDRIRSVRRTGGAVERPPDFDLAEAWAAVRDRVEDLRLPAVAHARATVEVVPLAQWVLGRRLTVGGPAPDGRIEVEVRGHGLRALAGELAGFGAALEITAPDELRQRLAEIGRELVGRYGDGS